MANVKKISLFHSATGKTVYAIIRRAADGYRLNDADGSFAAAPADPYLSLAEDTVIKGLYEVSESRAVWTNGKYEIFVYEQAGGSPAPTSDKMIGSGEIYISNDEEVTGFSALAVITGAKELGVDVTTSFGPIVMEKGEKRMIVYEMNEDGVPVDCTGFSFQLAVKGRAPDASYKIGPISGTLSTGSTGLQSLVTFLFTPDMTKALTPFSGVYEAALFDVSGHKVPLTERGGMFYTLKEDIIDVP